MKTILPKNRTAGVGIMFKAKRHKGKREKECVDQWAVLT
jgi:hypothetical protein